MHSYFDIFHSRRGRFGQEWKAIVAICAIVLLAGTAVRMQELPSWNQEAYKVAGEFIMGTHDAYHWLAGALGFGTAADQPPSRLLRVVSGLTGFSAGNTGFFLPAVFGGLVGAATVLWAWALGGLRAGLVAGVVATMAPGYYYRSRLGYYDTDIVTLLFPLLLTFGLALWLESSLRPSWLKRFGPERDPGRFEDGGGDQDAERARADAYIPDRFFLLWPALLGGFGAWAALWHGHMLTFLQLTVFMLLFLVAAAGRRGRRGALLWGVAAFAAAGFWGGFGFVGALAAALIAAALPASTRMRLNAWISGLALVLVVLVASGAAGAIIDGAASFLGSYVKPVAQQSAFRGREVGELVFPGIGQSVIEAQNLPLAEVFARFHPWNWLSLAGIGGFLFLLVLRPTALFLLPFLLISLASFKLGTRMAMFGAPAVGLGVGFLFLWMGRTVFGGRPWSNYALTLVLGAIAFVLALPGLSVFKELPPTPVLSRNHAEALIALGQTADEGSQVWTWWDWGYATHYYAQLHSFADGGRHYGEHVFTLGLALTTPNPLQSAQLIQFSALNDNEPWHAWEDMGMYETREFLRSLGSDVKNFAPETSQYVVATFENIRLSPWICYYGTWDFEKQKGVHARVASIRESFNLDWDEGAMVLQSDDEPVPVKSIHVLTADGRKDRHYEQNAGPHLILNTESQRYFAVDELAFQSMLVQLLIAPKDLERMNRHFELVYDDFPWVRIYKVRAKQPPFLNGGGTESRQ
ncbi:STT3 domain-containing protein [Oceanidesulfovibrio indonesiensis]|uniref:STT3 domain-containing protein n=1 Tax=Oceanidesulfovibrio indonesiensis TaxID=54767 RepID=UPI0014321798|nr:STT3 domain-containing protein [Oceanidesulfovibrio indonesiensis]